MATAGVSWTIGREGRNDFGESLAGKQYPNRRWRISGFTDDGKPLPLITKTDAGAERTATGRDGLQLPPLPSRRIWRIACPSRNRRLRTVAF